MTSSRFSRVTDGVFDGLLRALLRGDHQPGARLPSARELALEQGVTLSSVREALERLQQMGVVEHRADAYYARDWRRHGTLDVLGHLLLGGGTLSADVLGDALEVRSLAMRDIAALAAERADRADGAELDRLAQAVATAEGFDAAAEADFAFFTALARISRNVVFVLLLNAIGEMYLPRATSLPIADAAPELAPRYAQLAAAVAAGDINGARNAAWSLADRQRRFALATLPGRA